MADPEGLATTKEAVIKNIYPDVCLTDGEPVPYEICGYCDDHDMSTASQDVFLNADNAVHEKSRIMTVQGNEEGTDGGIESGINEGWCRPTKNFASTVYVNGQCLLRHDTEYDMNCDTPEGTANTTGKAVLDRSAPRGTLDPNGEIQPPDEDPRAAALRVSSGDGPRVEQSTNLLSGKGDVNVRAQLGPSVEVRSAPITVPGGGQCTGAGTLDIGKLKIGQNPSMKVLEAGGKLDCVWPFNLAGAEGYYRSSTSTTAGVGWIGKLGPNASARGYASGECVGTEVVGAWQNPNLIFGEGKGRFEICRGQPPEELFDPDLPPFDATKPNLNSKHGRKRQRRIEQLQQQEEATGAKVTRSSSQSPTPRPAPRPTPAPTPSAP